MFVLHPISANYTVHDKSSQSGSHIGSGKVGPQSETSEHEPTTLDPNHQRSSDPPSATEQRRSRHRRPGECNDSSESQSSTSPLNSPTRDIREECYYFPMNISSGPSSGFMPRKTKYTVHNTKHRQCRQCFSE